MFLSRSARCIVDNQTTFPLKMPSADSYKLEHGSLDTPLPESVPAGTKAEFTSSTAGFMTGTEGWVIYEVVGAGWVVEVGWDNPFIGANSFHLTFRPGDGAQGEEDRTPLVYADRDGTALDEQGGKDADDVVVTYTVKLKMPEAAAEGAGAGGGTPPAESTDPPPPSGPKPVDVPPGAEGHASDPSILTPPRLCVAINGVDPDPEGDKSDVSSLLEIIAKRLEGGLDVVWKKGAENKLWNPGKWKDTDDEEKWARALAELLLGLQYHGTAGIYGHINQDKFIYDPFSTSSDPVCSIAAACQHLVTYGTLSRGFTLADVANAGYSCSPARGLTGLSSWSDDAAGAKLNLATAIADGLTPGSFYVFNPDRTFKSQPEGAHIAFVMRVDAEQKKAQFFDTGGLQHPEHANTPPFMFHGYPGKGEYEDPWWDSVGTSYYCGMGILKKPADLASAVARLKKTRPLGLARLLLMKRGAAVQNAKGADLAERYGDGFLFLSKMLRMYGDKDDQNFTVARYYWSLRKLPGMKDIAAYWLFYAPVDGEAKPAKELLKGGRSVHIADMKEKLGSPTLLSVIGNAADGKVEQVIRTLTKLQPSGQSTTEAEPEMLEKPFKYASRTGARKSLGPSDVKLPPLFEDYSASGKVIA